MITVGNSFNMPCKCLRKFGLWRLFATLLSNEIFLIHTTFRYTDVPVWNVCTLYQQ